MVAEIHHVVVGRVLARHQAVEVLEPLVIFGMIWNCPARAGEGLDLRSHPRNKLEVLLEGRPALTVPLECRCEMLPGIGLATKQKP
jgi:hypothetical protein